MSQAIGIAARVILLQVNPLAETQDGKLIAADAKLGFDDNAAFRQKELMSLRDTSQEDPRCALVAAFLYITCFCLLQLFRCSIDG